MDTFIFAILLISISSYFQTVWILKNYKKFDTVSTLYAKEPYRDDFRIGLILTGILQIAFILSVDSNLKENSYLFIGQLLFMFGSVGSILLGIYSTTENHFVHHLSSFEYFLSLALGGFFISISLDVSENVLIFIVGIILSWILFSLYQKNKTNPMYAIETSHVLLSYVWILVIGILQLF